jgi:mono/diheme cytochrome c family protein
MKRQIIITSLLLSLLGPFAHAQDQADEAKQLFADNCVRCHGADGKGNTKMGRKLRIKDLTSPKLQARLTSDRISEAIRDGSQDSEGKERMPSFADKLTEQQRAAVATYVKTLGSGAE